jgi:hypothetical protein
LLVGVVEELVKLAVGLRILVTEMKVMGETPQFKGHP